MLDGSLCGGSSATAIAPQLCLFYRSLLLHMNNYAPLMIVPVVSGAWFQERGFRSVVSGAGPSWRHVLATQISTAQTPGPDYDLYGQFSFLRWNINCASREYLFRVLAINGCGRKPYYNREKTFCSCCQISIWTCLLYTSPSPRDS